MFPQLPAEMKNLVASYLTNPADRICLDIALQQDGLPSLSTEELEQADYDQEDYEQEERDFWDSVPEYDDDFQVMPDFDDLEDGFEYPDYDLDFGYL